MNMVANEVAFLRRFRARFSSLADYKKALADMLGEGLITRVAYNKVIETKKTAARKKSSVSLDISSCGSCGRTTPRKRVTERVQITDSCGGSASWSSSC